WIAGAPSPPLSGPWHGKIAFSVRAMLRNPRLAGGRQIGVDLVDQRADVVAHRLVGDEHDDRDRCHDQRVFSHRLTLAHTPVPLTDPNQRLVYEFHVLNLFAETSE